MSTSRSYRRIDERVWNTGIVRHCVRPVQLACRFPLAGPLPSIPSAEDGSGRQRSSRFPSPVVRGLHGYYGAIRLPAFVHHRRTSEDFPMRPVPWGTGKRGISRVPREAFPHMHGVSDRAGFRRASRWRHAGCCLPHLLTASAPRREFLSRLNTRPARTPVNASPSPLRTTTHDSGPLWAANPSTYDSFIHNTSPA